MAYPAPHIDPAQLRPRRYWYAIVGMVAALLVCAGPALFIFGIVSFVRDFPTVQPFTDRTTTTVALHSDRPAAIYVEMPASRASGQSFNASCTGRAVAGGAITLGQASGTFTLSEPGHTWLLLYHLEVTQDGQYELTCRSHESEAEVPLFGVGDDLDIGGLFAKTFGGFAALFALPVCGIVFGVAFIVLIAVRRNAHRRRLESEWTAPPQY